MSRRRVLLVGGDVVAAALREYFQVCHANDCDVESLEYCDDALMTLQRRPCDVVLLLSLRVWRTWPGLDRPARHIGGESAILFLKQIRALANPVPVLLVSGLSSADLEAEALANGAFAVVPKPIMFAELEHVLDAVPRPADQDRWPNRLHDPT